MKVKFELLDNIANNFHYPDFKLANFFIDDPVVGPVNKNNPIAMPTRFLDHVEEIKDFTVHPDDVWVITYPKCGTTLAQEAVWQICNGVTLNESGLPLPARFPFLEFNSFVPSTPTTIERARQMPRPRFIKSHLPLHFLPDQLWTVRPKVVFVLREPKDTAVSYYHHNVNIGGWQGTKTEFMQLFLKGHIAWGDYWLHTKSMWSKVNEANVKLLRFENLKADLRGTVEQLALFLGKTLTEEELSKLLHHLSFKSMKENPLVNMDEVVSFSKKKYGLEQSGFSFIRKGQVGSHKDEMEKDLIEAFNQRTKQEFQVLGIGYVENL